MSKTKYEEPVMNIITFQTADIITTSGNTDSFDGEGVKFGYENDDDFLIP